MQNPIVTKTTAGWVVESTGWSHGYQAYVQGAACGRRVLYTRSTLDELGIPYDADPTATGACNDPYITHADLLLHHEPDRVLAAGYRVE